MNVRLRPVLVVACALVATVALGCGDDDSNTKSGDTACLDISGSWTIASHCQTALVGSSATVHQSGCSISSVDPWTGWSGSATSGNAITMSGPAGTVQMNCSGAMSTTEIAMTCNPTCDVKLTRGK